ncbi:hypothetical protein NSS79_24230 [Paenibacillus sp. FSL L8-0436]|uniref:hypothetical protein n=1 Tax=Paenibacillus sp. FSL L8-0436 TaxID=2954686 RepID=UPI00315820E2
MRHYYILQNDNRISRELTPVNMALLKAPFTQMPPAQVLEVQAAAEQDFTDWLPLSAAVNPLLSDSMKRILELYNTQARFKQLYVINREDQQQVLYWTPHVPALDGISGETEWYPHDHTLKQLVLDAAKVKGHHFFRLSGIREPHYIISLEAAESLLRRGLSGYRLQMAELCKGAGL